MDYPIETSDQDLPDPKKFIEIVDKEDIGKIISSQQELLSRLEKTNAMLQTVNELSSQRFESLVGPLRTNIRHLVSMRRELSAILKKTDSIKKNLMKQYPAEYQQAHEAVESAWKAKLDAESESLPETLPASLIRSLDPLTE